MIVLAVISAHGKPPPAALRGTFGDSGGTFGRSPECTLCLADDQRAVSRVHGEVRCDGPQFHLVDRGTNPLKVNGRELGNGRSVPIEAGDRIEVGPYILEVSAEAPVMAAAPPQAAAPAPHRSGQPRDAPSANPFDDLLGDAPAPPPAKPDTFAAGARPQTQAPDDEDPFAGLGAGLGNGQSDAAAPPSAAGIDAILPDDFDFMAEPSDDKGPGAGTSDAPENGLDPLSSAPDAPGRGSLDALFDLTPDDQNPSSTSDDTDQAAPGVDGLSDWDTRPEDIGPAQKDNVAAINTPFIPFPPRTSKSPPAPREPAYRAPATPPARPARTAAAGASTRTAADKAQVPETTSDISNAALRDALLKGLRATDLPIDEVTPEMMYRLANLLREATEGTLTLLNARATIKKELRADVTMIAGGQNNPLKFSPDAQSAIRHFFGTPTPGFMPAEQAMRDAYDDLRAHEIGFMSGLRAALAGVLAQFDPQRLEQRLPKQGALNSLLPAGRKARLWELFGELYREISAEAEEDFNTLFGREFLKAYDMQISAMRAAANKGSKR